MTPHVEQLIVVGEKRGKGVEHDPVRTVTRVYRFDGEFVAEWDAWAADEQALANVVMAGVQPRRLP